MSIRKLTGFKSSNVKAAAYDTKSHDLDVTFKDGSRYDYSNVGAARFRQFQEAPSKGKFVHEKLKPNYPVAREK